MKHVKTTLLSNLSLTIQIDLVSYFGSFIPMNIDNFIEVSTTGLYLLTNTEFLFDANLIGFEFYANEAGNLNLQVS